MDGWVDGWIDGGVHVTKWADGQMGADGWGMKRWEG